MRSRPQWGSRLFFFYKKRKRTPTTVPYSGNVWTTNHLQPYCLVNLNVMWKDWIAIFRVQVTVRLWNSSVMWTAELFPTELGMVVRHCEPQCWVSHVVWLPGLKGQVQVGLRIKNAHISHILFFFFFFEWLHVEDAINHSDTMLSQSLYWQNSIRQQWSIEILVNGEKYILPSICYYCHQFCQLSNSCKFVFDVMYFVISQCGM